MSRVVIVAVAFVLVVVACGYGKYSGGSGEVGNPFRIGTAADIMKMSHSPEDWSGHFLMIDDVDLGAYTFDRAVIAFDSDAAKSGFQGVGFTGVFDGNGHAIENLSILNGKNHVGFFGYVREEGEVKKLSLEGVNIETHNVSFPMGTLVGELRGIVTECSSRGRIKKYGRGGVCGGLIGELFGGRVIRCQSASAIEGFEYDGYYPHTLGGLVGRIRAGGVEECLSTGYICGYSLVGGLIGDVIGGRILDCYAEGKVVGTERTGGLVGRAYVNCSIINCYSAGEVVGETSSGGLLGESPGGDVISSFWDMEASKKTWSAAGEGRSTCEMMSAETVALWGVGQATWTIAEGEDYPRLAWEGRVGETISTVQWQGEGTVEAPYLIETAQDFGVISSVYSVRDKHFKLIRDVDLSLLNSSFSGIGTDIAWEFAGVFDGGGHTINGFVGDAENVKYQGLFRRVSGGTVKNLNLFAPLVQRADYAGAVAGAVWGGEITNCHVVDCGVSGDTHAGGLVGYTSGAVIQGCSANGIVGGNGNVGGIAGASDGVISRSSSECAVISGRNAGGAVGHLRGLLSQSRSAGNVVGGADSDHVGGLVGTVGDSARILNCYAQGAVTGGSSADVGGLVGRMQGEYGLVVNSYSTGEVSGNADSILGGLVGADEGSTCSLGCFWDAETSGVGTSAFGTGLSTSALQNESLYKEARWGWEEGVWTIEQGRGYPRLAWEGCGGRVVNSPIPWNGNGDPNDPYLIGSVEELNAIGLGPVFWNKHFLLQNDIDMASLPGVELQPIGVPTEGAEFRGVFEGAGHRIAGIVYHGRDDYVGLFRCVGPGGKVRNVGLVAPRLLCSSAENVGSLVGCLKQGEVTGCRVDACSVEGGDRVGGAVGYIDGGLIRDSHVDGSVSGGSGIGGMIGRAENAAVISRCYARVSVVGDANVGGLSGECWVYDTKTSLIDCHAEGDIAGDKHVGGLLGYNVGARVSRCCFRGVVNSRENPDPPYLGNAAVGGLVGYNSGLAGEDEGIIEDCYASGFLDGCIDTSNAGGLVGSNRGLIRKCHAAVAVSGYRSVGGLVGSNSGEIRDSYAAGPVTGAEQAVGGLVGSNHPQGIVTGCYSVGAVAAEVGDAYAGGLIGYRWDGAAVGNSYWDKRTSGWSTSKGGIGLTTEQMQSLPTYINAGWDFVGETSNGTRDIWSMRAEGSYPLLCGVLNRQYGGGDGSACDPFEIWTAEEMYAVSQFLIDWDKHFRLMADIDLGRYDGLDGREGWGAIGYLDYSFEAVPFTGVFDGNGKSISGFSYAPGGRGFFGLFGYVEGEGAFIKNLELISPAVNARLAYATGGLVGHLTDGKIADCWIEGGQVAAGSMTGGMLGNNYRGKVLRCSVSGSVCGEDQVGGLVGYSSVSAQIIDCYSESTVQGDRDVGGLVGESEGMVRGSGSRETVGGMARVGGLIGTNTGRVEKSFADVAVSGLEHVGGFVGQNTGHIVGMIEDCYALGSVSGQSVVGGFAGVNWLGGIHRCFAAGHVSLGGVSELWGGLVGYNIEGISEASFWDTDATGLDTSARGVSKNTVQMQKLSTFLDAGWDFVGEDLNGVGDVWRMCLDGVGYPRLSWEYSCVGDFACGDGVGMEDLVYLCGRWLCAGEESGAADADGDGVVGMGDFSVFAERWLD